MTAQFLKIMQSKAAKGHLSMTAQFLKAVQSKAVEGSIEHDCTISVGSVEQGSKGLLSMSSKFWGTTQTQVLVHCRVSTTKGRLDEYA